MTQEGNLRHVWLAGGTAGICQHSVLTSRDKDSNRCIASCVVLDRQSVTFDRSGRRRLHLVGLTNSVQTTLAGSGLLDEVKLIIRLISKPLIKKIKQLINATCAETSSLQLYNWNALQDFGTINGGAEWNAPPQWNTRCLQRKHKMPTIKERQRIAMSIECCAATVLSRVGTLKST